MLSLEAKRATPAPSSEGAETKHSLLSDLAIVEHIRKGSIVIFPFERANLCTSR
jgi:hypothetical protein